MSRHVDRQQANLQYCVVALDGNRHEIEGVASVYGPFDTSEAAEAWVKQVGQKHRKGYRLIELEAHPLSTALGNRLEFT